MMIDLLLISSFCVAIEWSLLFLTLRSRIVFLLLFHEAAEHANFFVAIRLKVKAILLAESQLQQVIIKTLLGHTDFLGRILKRPSLQLKLLLVLRIRDHDAIVELSPGAHFLDDIRDSPLLGPGIFLRLIITSLSERNSFFLVI